MTTKLKRAPTTDQPLTVNDVAAATLIGCGKTLFLAMDSDGRLGPQPIRYGRKRVWDRAELIEWFHAGRPRREAWAKVKQPTARPKAG